MEFCSQLGTGGLVGHWGIFACSAKITPKGVTSAGNRDGRQVLKMREAARKMPRVFHCMSRVPGGVGKGEGLSAGNQPTGKPQRMEKKIMVDRSKISMKNKILEVILWEILWMS
ncbi:unnamed protein product [Boreogadus saida]